MSKQNKTLLLNADYLAINVLSVERAFVLLMQNKVQLIDEDPDRKMRTKRSEFPFPLVVRLVDYRKVPYKKVPLSRQNVFRRDGYVCAYCGASKNLTLDHVIPKAHGGRTTWHNLVTACKPCNARKDDKPMSETGYEFVYSKPYRPSFVMYASNYLNIPECWKPYLYM